MSKWREIVADQEPSLVRELYAHNIRHGDVVQGIEMQGVGFRTHAYARGEKELVFSFCPTRIVGFDKIRWGNYFTRLFKIPHRVLWAPDSERILRESTPSGCGFARIKCDITSNGAIHISNVRVLGTESTPPDTVVNGAGAYEQFRSLQAESAY